MAKIRQFHREYIAPAIAIHRKLWTTLLWERWDPLPLDEKLIWLFFAGNTLAIFILIEFLFLK